MSRDRLTTLLEVCIENTEQAKNALIRGASRLELCSDLKVGGMSPSLNLISEVSAAVHSIVSKESPILPLQIMVRLSEPSFEYTSEHIQRMLDYIAEVKDLNLKLVLAQTCAPAERRQSFISGFVFGCLTTTKKDRSSNSTHSCYSDTSSSDAELSEEKEIDAAQTALLVQAAKPFATTFHRAFDEISDKKKAIITLRTLEVDRLLTSGGIGSVDAHMDCLRELIHLSGLNAPRDIGLLPKDGTTLSQGTGDASESMPSPHDYPTHSEPGLPLKPLLLMPGGGVRSHNAAQLIALGAVELHSSTPFFISEISSYSNDELV